MMTTHNLRKLALTLHVVSSVGWVGAVSSFIVLAITGLASPDVQLARASYLAMDLTYRWVIVPLGLASLITGLVSSLSTDWALFRHYWVLLKVLLTVPATILMLVHIQPVTYLAAVATTRALSSAHVPGLQIQLAAYAGAALLMLLTATVLSTYEPRGRTRYGALRLKERSAGIVPH